MKMKKIKEKIVELYFTVLYEIKLKLFLIENSERYKKDFERNLYHDKLMESVLNHCDNLPKYDPKNADDNFGSLYVGYIPKDWEERIDIKIAQKNKEAEKE